MSKNLIPYKCECGKIIALYEEKAFCTGVHLPKCKKCGKKNEVIIEKSVKNVPHCAELGRG